MLTNGTYFLLLQRGEIRGDVVPAKEYPLAQQNPAAHHGWVLCLEMQRSGWD